MKLYVSAPMTGFPDWNVPYMEKIAKELRALGHEVLLPKPEQDIRVAMSNDCAMVCQVDGIVMCPGWEKSDGCFTEWRLAVRCKKDIYYINSWSLGDVPNADEKIFGIYDKTKEKIWN